MNRAALGAPADGHARGAEVRATEYAELLDAAIRSMMAALEQVRLPLHILLTSPFGELNENQEEMLDAAQQAADAADADLARVRKLIEIDRGTAAFSSEPVAVGELLRAPLAIARARGSHAAVRVVDVVPDNLPRALADPLAAQEALTALVGYAAACAPAGGEIHVRASLGESSRLFVEIEPVVAPTIEPFDVMLAKRVLMGQCGSVISSTHGWVVEMPIEGNWVSPRP